MCGCLYDRIILKRVPSRGSPALVAFLTILPLGRVLDQKGLMAGASIRGTKITQIEPK